MKKPLPTRISIYLSVDAHSVCKYYNSHDPAPLYNRQLSQGFEGYLLHTVAPAKSTSGISYKLICKKGSDQRFTEPILMSIRRHFKNKRTMKEQEFTTFKKRNYVLLPVILLAVIILQAALPVTLDGDYRIHPFLGNALFVFSCVILWKPIERLIFYRDPFRKEILLLKKMENAESIVIANEKEFALHLKYNDAA